jgi:excisionase family DNA binding protein
MEQILTVAEVARYLRLSTKTVYQLAAKKQIPHVRIGNSFRFRRADLDSWSAARQTAPNGDRRDVSSWKSRAPSGTLYIVACLAPHDRRRHTASSYAHAAALV